MTEYSPTYFPYGQQALEERFSILLHCIGAVMSHNDEDAIHDVRVASRRFHAAAQMFSDCLPAELLKECERYVKKIRKSTGKVRDEDVQRLFIEQLPADMSEKQYHAGMKRLRLRLWQRREKKVKRVVSAIDEFQKYSIAEKMNHALSTPITQTSNQEVLRRKAEREIGSHLGKLLSFQHFVNHPEAATELHTLRIAAKHLRYILEIFDPAYNQRLKPYIVVIKSLQDSLGEMHDCDVWLQTLPIFLEKERIRTVKYLGETTAFPRIEKGILYLIDYVRSQRSVYYKKFLNTWKKCEKKRMWNLLLECLKN